MFVSQKKTQVAELLDAVLHCEFADDAEANNDFDITVVSDASRFTETVAYHSSEAIYTDHLGSVEYNGTVVGAVFTGGSWTADQLKGYRCWAYKDDAVSAGAWHEIISNSIGTITSATSFATGVNRIRLQARALIRHNIQLIPQPGFYGSFIKYTATKKLQSDGNFKLFDFEANMIPVNVDPEFLAGMGAITNAWE